jgi:hypothetical protein
VTTVTMIDATGASAHNIPQAPKVAGYVTGSGIVPWSAADWALFPHSGHVRIDQDAGASDPLGSDVLDVEYQAATVAEVPGWVKTRIAHGITWSTIYGTDSTLAACRAALDAAGPHGWYAGHVDCWLADWNLSQAQAAALVGTLVHGLSCRAVQWASPSSNPATIVPGSHLTLAQANVDLSVAAESWHPAPSTPKPPPPPPAQTAYMVVRLPDGATSKMLSGMTLK